MLNHHNYVQVDRYLISCLHIRLINTLDIQGLLGLLDEYSLILKLLHQIEDLNILLSDSNNLNLVGVVLHSDYPQKVVFLRDYQLECVLRVREFNSLE